MPHAGSKPGTWRYGSSARRGASAMGAQRCPGRHDASRLAIVASARALTARGGRPLDGRAGIGGGIRFAHGVLRDIDWPELGIAVDAPGEAPVKGPSPKPGPVSTQEQGPNTPRADLRGGAGAGERPDASASGRPEDPAVERILQLGCPEQVITALWNLSYERLIRRALARQVSLPVAEDILQDVFSLLARELDRVRGPRILGWLGTMVDYECARHFSKVKRARLNERKAQVNAAELVAAMDAAPLDQKLDRKRGLDQARSALAALGALDEYIIQAAVDGVDAVDAVAEIQRRFGVSLSSGALYERRRRIRLRLREQLSRGGSHD
jgi:DNA-directed RNA polymerase specialized sigma24 family protein